MFFFAVVESVQYCTTTANRSKAMWPTQTKIVLV